jgi:predicted P-loop ATPase
VLLRRGEKHWLTDEEELMRQEFVRQFNEADPWEECILAYVAAASLVRMPEILTDVLEIPRERQSRREEQRVSAILRRNGWTPDQRRIGGQKLRIWARRQTP